MTALEMMRAMHERRDDWRGTARQHAGVMGAFRGPAAAQQILAVRTADELTYRSRCTDGSILVLVHEGAYLLGPTGPGWARPATSEELDARQIEAGRSQYTGTTLWLQA